MKLAITVFAGLAIGLVSTPALAFAVYNHVDKEVCVQSLGNEILDDCYLRIPASGAKNGAKDAGLDNVRVYWFSSDTKCKGSDDFSVPKSGYARIYSGRVEIYNKKDEKVGSSHVSDVTCPGIILRKQGRPPPKHSGRMRFQAIDLLTERLAAARFTGMIAAFPGRSRDRRSPLWRPSRKAACLFRPGLCCRLGKPRPGQRSMPPLQPALVLSFGRTPV